MKNANQVIDKPQDGSGAFFGEVIEADMSGYNGAFSIGKTIITLYSIEVNRE